MTTRANLGYYVLGSSRGLVIAAPFFWGGGATERKHLLSFEHDSRGFLTAGLIRCPLITR
jgi:hypothetical protein